jgi:Flp pilus assembly pilin Flp
MKKKKLSQDESGQSLIEYIILVALVVLVCVTSTKLLGTKINSKLRDIKNEIDSGIDVKLSP